MSWHKKAFDFDGWTARLTATKNEQLKKHLFLGTSLWTGEPILLNDAIGEEHIWVTGGSGSGKSARILAPLAAQAIARRDRSVAFIDPKPDLASFWNCFDSAYRAKLPFKYFSVVPGDESFIFNPLRQEVHRRITPMQQAEQFLQATGTDFGDKYGASFFLGMSELTVCNYLTHYAKPPIEDYGDLFRLFNDKHSYAAIGQLDDWANASQLRPILARAASTLSATACPRNFAKASAHANAIEIFDLFRTPSVYYFKLPASLSRNTCRFFARSILQLLFASAGLRGPGETTPVFLICDEFQELVGPSIDVFLEQCRSRGISCVLAHQSISQLERNGAELLNVVQACTSTHIVVEASDFESIEYVQRRSGQAYTAMTSWSQAAPAGETHDWFGHDLFRAWRATTSDGVSTPLVNVREEIAYRLSENFIRRASADASVAFIAIKKNSGFSNFDGFMIPVRSYFHIDKDLFDKRNQEPWPRWDRPETLIVTPTNPFAPASPSSKSISQPVHVILPPPDSEAALRDRLRMREGDQRRRPGDGPRS